MSNPNTVMTRPFMVVELGQLDSHIMKLEEFLQSKYYKPTTPDDKQDLLIQLQCMRQYKLVLARRLSRTIHKELKQAHTQ